jgi:photosystem II stability/assembly factor-like uncharacterized protein
MTKPDTVDQKISLLVAELVDLAPLPPPLPDGDAVRRWRERRRRRLALRSLTVASAAAAVAVAVALAVPAGVTESPHWALAGDISSAWRQVSGMGPTSGFSLTCPSTTTCYAEGPGSFDPGSVEVTRDGGRTWQPAPTKGETPLSNVACSSTGECAFLEALFGGKPVLVETANAGKTWVSRPGPPELSGDSIGSIALSCPSASTCTVVASNLEQPGGPSGAFVTGDGGRTWSASPIPTAWPSQLQCFPNTRCISTGAGPNPGGHLSASYSTDSGLNWAPAIVPSVPGGPVRPVTLSCSSSETCMAVPLSYGAAGAYLVVSGNGGESWSRLQAQGLPVGKVFGSLACPTASQCWVSGNTPLHVADGRMTVGDTAEGAVLSSTDGGRTWLSTGLPKGIAGVGPLSCPDPSTCFALAFKTRVPPLSGAPEGPLTFALLVYTK